MNKIKKKYIIALEKYYKTIIKKEEKNATTNSKHTNK
jgi:hypothetical protein